MSFKQGLMETEANLIAVSEEFLRNFFALTNNHLGSFKERSKLRTIGRSLGARN